MKARLHLYGGTFPALTSVFKSYAFFFSKLILWLFAVPYQKKFFRESRSKRGGNAGSCVLACTSLESCITRVDDVLSFEESN